ncbi:hypothetical protein QR680_010118 [Steinernema hermaphroditum]|uniref:Major facilitator superfamily (MFS) profile domain-containing protein n=1 Tax=Steinernema hermaphroditum TaxID=289476 RepID=A0AA39IMT8_9BILA|nr:hypothetical protein QR680_010118 [Steinernema hermaphroditum]
MTFGICCMVLGNILYLSCELFPHDRRYVLLMARFITGIGSANVALIRTYASTACHPDDRGRAISFITVGLSMGIMLGPAFQMFFTPISYPGWVIFGGLSVSMYTMPAYAACTMNLFALFTLHFCFKESYAGLSEESEIENNIPKYDIVAVVTCNFTRFVQQLIYTNLDIVAGPFALTVFGYPKQMAVQTASTAMTAHGAVAAFLLAVFIIFKLQNYVKYRISTMVAMGIFLVHHLITYPWPFYTGKIMTYTNEGISIGASMSN